MTEIRAAILSYAENRESFRFSNLLVHLNGMFKISKVNLSWHLREMVKDNCFNIICLQTIYIILRLSGTKWRRFFILSKSKVTLRILILIRNLYIIIYQ